MKKSSVQKKWRFIVPIFIIIMVCIIFANSRENKKLEVKHWDNLYNENNIQMYYEESDHEKIKQLNAVYSVEEIVSTESSEINKVLKVVDIVNRIVEFDDVSNSKKLSAYDILQSKGTLKKVSQRDMAIITRDLILSLGIKARVGEFRSIKQGNYFVVEYWSQENNKWIMIDFRDRGYITNNAEPCSAIEVIKCSKKDLNYVGNKDSKVYINELKKITQTYSINIDNTIAVEKSNSYITYVESEKYVSLNYNDKHIMPTIFTNNEEIFSKNPIEDEIGEDDKAYIILMKKEVESNNNEYIEQKYIVGAFRNSRIMDDYFLKHNSGEFKNVKKYYELELVNGINLIELSIDGETIVSSIEIYYNE